MPSTQWTVSDAMYSTYPHVSRYTAFPLFMIAEKESSPKEGCQQWAVGEVENEKISRHHLTKILIVQMRKRRSRYTLRFTPSLTALWCILMTQMGFLPQHVVLMTKIHLFSHFLPFVCIETWIRQQRGRR